MTSVLGDWNLGGVREGGAFTGKAGGGIFRIFLCKENEEKEKRERNKRERKTEKESRKRKRGWEQARVPNLLYIE